MVQTDARTFDAHYKWLAIPPHEQPPNHYRLLGVELFEQDLDVIAAAADRQMAHVKCFTSGKYASHSQRLLNELAAARICLLHPEQKSRYDMQLKRQLPIGQPREPISTPQVLTVGEGGMTTDIQIQAGPPSYRRKRSSGFGQGVVKVIFILLMMIPMIIIAYRIDLVNMRQPEVNVRMPEQKNVPAPPQQKSQPAPRTPSAPVPRKNATPLIEIDREPLGIKPYEPDGKDVIQAVAPRRPQQRIVLNLENKVQRAAVTIVQPAKVIGMESGLYEVKPTHGSLAAGPVQITIAGPRVITFTIKANDRDQVTITATVENDEGREVPFTTDTLEALHRRIVKNGERAVANVAAMQGEKDRIEAWLNSSLIKPLATVRSASARSKELDVLIKEAKPTVEALEKEAKAVGELVQFAHQLHGKSAILFEQATAGN